MVKYEVTFAIRVAEPSSDYVSCKPGALHQNGGIAEMIVDKVPEQNLPLQAGTLFREQYKISEHGQEIVVKHSHSAQLIDDE